MPANHRDTGQAQYIHSKGIASRALPGGERPYAPLSTEYGTFLGSGCDAVKHGARKLKVLGGQKSTRRWGKEPSILAAELQEQMLHSAASKMEEGTTVHCVNSSKHPLESSMETLDLAIILALSVIAVVCQSHH